MTTNYWLRKKGIMVLKIFRGFHPDNAGWIVESNSKEFWRLADELLYSTSTVG